MRAKETITIPFHEHIFSIILPHATHVITSGVIILPKPWLVKILLTNRVLNRCEEWCGHVQAETSDREIGVTVHRDKESLRVFICGCAVMTYRGGVWNELINE